MFSSAEQLVHLVVDGFRDWRASCWKQLKKLEAQHRPARDRMLLILTGSLVAATLVALAIGAVAGAPAGSLPPRNDGLFVLIGVMRRRFSLPGWP